MKQIIEVKVKSVYGNTLIYPANKEAELLAAIAGTKTISTQTLDLAKLLGFEVKQVEAFSLGVAA